MKAHTWIRDWIVYGVCGGCAFLTTVVIVTAICCFYKTNKRHRRVGV